jgi:hypothetical protein
MARDAAAAEVPEGTSKEEWDKHIAYARDVELYAEYALFAVELIGALEGQNPKSKYLENAYGAYFMALSQTGAGSRIPAIAEKALASFPRNEDLLLVLADNAMDRKQSDRALSNHPKPEEMSAAAWERKRNRALGRGHWIAGMMHSEKAQYMAADQDLRAALPLIKGNDAMTAAALFHLGLAKYQLGKMTLKKAQVLEAVKFSEQAAAFQGPFAQQAWHNAQVMKTEAGRMR